jgi:hypothetical protein
MLEAIIEELLDFVRELLRQALYKNVLKREAPASKAKPAVKARAAQEPVKRGRKRRRAGLGSFVFNVALIVIAALVLRNLIRRRLSR